MTDNLPEVRRSEPSREISRQDTDSWIPVLGNVIELANAISATDFVPKGLRGSATATAAAILYGREVGLPPMTALTQTHVIEGKPAMSAEAMRAMVLAAGHDIVITETSSAICTMRARRAGSDFWTTISWTIDEARQAGVASKQVWRSYPRQMLQARATTELCRLVFPDVIHGFRSLEEYDVLDGVVVEDDEGNTAPAEPGTKVTRKRTAKKAAPSRPAPAEEPAERPVLDGPPLPGEPGYDPDPQAPAAEGSESAGGDAEGEAADPPADDQEPAEDVVDAVVVEEELPPPLDTDEPRVEVETNPKPGPSTSSQQRLILTRFGALDVKDRDERLRFMSVLIGREVESTKKISKAEASTLIETLGFIDDRAALEQLVRGVEERRS